MIPYGRQNINKHDIQAVVKVLRSDWITQGPTVRALEEAIASWCGARYGIAVSNGTAALHLMYLAAGIGQGDEVITTPNTFVATANMLLAVGAKPVFSDIRLDTYNIDETKIEQLVTKRTKAIVPVHFAGQPPAMDVIWRIVKKHRLIVIEDGAQALGARYKDTPVGGGKSDMVMFSFHPVKSITTGEGGVIVTNNEMYYKKLLLLRSHGVTKDEQGFNVMTDLGYNYRMTDIQAALGVSQLKRLETFINKRHEVAGWYEAALRRIEGIVLPPEVKDCYSAWHIYVIRTKRVEDRMPLYKHLLNAGIGVNFHYPCVYRHPYYQKHGFQNAYCPNADLYAETAITLPLHTLLKKKEVEYIADAIKQYFDEAKARISKF